MTLLAKPCEPIFARFSRRICSQACPRSPTITPRTRSLRRQRAGVHQLRPRGARRLVRLPACRPLAGSPTDTKRPTCGDRPNATLPSRLVGAAPAARRPDAPALARAGTGAVQTPACVRSAVGTTPSSRKQRRARVLCERTDPGPDWGAVASRLDRLLPVEVNHRYDEAVGRGRRSHLVVAPPSGFRGRMNGRPKRAPGPVGTSAKRARSAPSFPSFGSQPGILARHCRWRATHFPSAPLGAGFPLNAY